MSNSDITQSNKPSSSTVPNLASRHSLSIAHIWRAIRNGELEAVKFGRATRVTKEAEKKWLKSRQKRCTSTTGNGA